MPALRTPVIAWLVSRVIIATTAIVGSALLGRPPGSMAPDPAVPKSLSFLGSWDTAWYLDLARHGYAQGSPNLTHFTNLAFFPGLALIMLIGVETGSNPFVWGLLASNLAFLGGLVAVRAIVGDRWGTALGERAVWVTALAPPAVYSVLAYTDGLLFGIAACAAWAATRNRWAVAGLLAGAAILVRPQGALVAVLIVMLAWTIAADSPRCCVIRTAYAVVPGVAALAGFLVWMQFQHGSWSLPLRAQAAWGRTSLGVGSIHGLAVQAVAIVDCPVVSDHSALSSSRYTCTPVGWTAPFRDLAATAVMLALIVALIRFVGTWRSPWVVFAALAVLTPLQTGVFTSMARFGLLAFPLAWPVAAWVEQGGSRRARWTGAVATVVIVALTLQLRKVAP